MQGNLAAQRAWVCKSSQWVKEEKASKLRINTGIHVTIDIENEDTKVGLETSQDQRQQRKRSSNTTSAAAEGGRKTSSQTESEGRRDLRPGTAAPEMGEGDGLLVSR
ncbi:hypothetical protein ElyMa_001908000 [Elysia marginata]|uniref:Uncharacterized protein n=1 Tax=Elysia marginata TaxID=1093978 RepID=A0AAV4ERV4_9GAST|nr:hypothetical protein ElyMa_001908000 [Elysia marginata]